MQIFLCWSVIPDCCGCSDIWIRRWTNWYYHVSWSWQHLESKIKHLSSWIVSYGKCLLDWITILAKVFETIKTSLLYQDAFLWYFYTKIFLYDIGGGFYMLQSLCHYFILKDFMCLSYYYNVTICTLFGWNWTTSSVGFVIKTSVKWCLSKSQSDWFYSIIFKRHQYGMLLFGNFLWSTRT